MAQADSVPSPIRTSVTGESAKRSTNSRSAARLRFIKNANTSQLSIGSKIRAVSYATAVLLLAPLPWNFLLMLLLFLSRDKRLRFSAFDRTVSMRCTVFSGRGSFR
jgi:hypothetical protein